jgi:hypothetical protein
MKASLAVLCCLLTSCVASLKRGTRPNTGTYSIHRTQAVPAQATSVVTGIVFDVATKQPMPGAIIAFANKIILTDSQGRFRYEGRVGTYAVLGGAIGYYRVDIAKLKLAAGEQVELTFWIAQDQRPIYCD